MAGFDDIEGQKGVVTHFKNAIKLNRISHAYILNGEKGMGKKTIARAFSMTLMCERHGESPCMECHACKQIMTDNNPDVRWVTHEKPNVISVDEVRRQINTDVQIKPYSSDYKIYIVDDADKMNQPAQNAILKTIEEPPPYVVILLLTVNKDMLLSTILSRCVSLELRPLRKQQVESYLVEKAGIVDYKAREVSDFAGGNIGKAIRLASSDDFMELKESVARVAKNIAKMTAADINAAIKEISSYKENIEEYLELLFTWYRDVLIYKSCGEKGYNINQKIIFADYIKFIRQQSEACSYEAIERIFTELDGINEKLRVNVNFDMVIELLLLTVRDGLRGDIKPEMEILLARQ